MSDKVLLDTLKSDRACNYNIFHCFGLVLLKKDEYKIMDTKDKKYEDYTAISYSE